MLAAEHDAGKVDGDHALPPREVGLFDGVPAGDSSVVHDHVEAAKLPLYERHRFPPGTLIAHVLAHVYRPGLLGQGRGKSILQVAEYDECALLQEAAHRRCANTGGSSCNQRNLAR